MSPSRPSGPAPPCRGRAVAFSIPALLSSAAILPALWLPTKPPLVRDGGGFGEMGMFSAALRWNQSILFIPSSLAKILLAMLANSHGAGDKDEFRGVFRLSLSVNLAVTLAPAALVIAFCAAADARLRRRV